MRLLHVYPISRGIAKDELTYFTSIEAAPGSIVSVPLRSKTIPALIISSEDVSDARAELRQSDFALRKIAARSARALFFPAYVDAILKASEYYAAAPGALFAATIPSTLFKEPLKLSLPEKILESKTGGVIGEKLIFQGGPTERLEHHKNLVREEFARNRSVFILVPTVRDLERLNVFLSRGIPDFVFALHGSLPEKEMRARWNKAVTLDHPVVIIGTGSFLSIPRSDIGTIIVERESAGSYKAMARPFADMRVVAERMAEALHARFILADLPLRVESVHRFRAGDFDERAPIRTRAVATAEATLVDMREEKSPDKKEKFVVLSQTLVTGIKETLAAKENVFLFTVRRGMSPLTVCEDCGNTVLCDVTKTPVTLHKGPKGNVFVCHSCGAIRPGDERCRFCNSWRLQSLGIGSQFVEELVRKTFPDTELFAIDRDRTKTHREAAKVSEKFAAAKGAILLGTEMALPYLPDAVPLAGIVSIDSLLSLPEWNAFERVFGIITRLRSAASKKLILQSRKTEADVLEFALRGNTSDFYKGELEARKQFGYPPFTMFIKITCEGTAAKASSDMKDVENAFEPYGFSGRSHLMHTGKGRYVVHGFLRIQKKEWPNPEIVSLLRSLPPHITVTVDPDSIL